jgi:glutathione S-transferase
MVCDHTQACVEPANVRLNMKLYHHPMSSNGRRAVITVKLLGLDSQVELHSVDLTKGAHREPDFVAMNPNAKVPVLVDGEFKLWESQVIMMYLCDKFPKVGHSLYPIDLQSRANIHRWLFWSSTHWMPYIGTLNMENMLKPMLGWGPTDDTIVAKANTDMAPYIHTLDQHLAAHMWVNGNTMSLADVAIATPLMSQMPARLPTSGAVHIQRWFGEFKKLAAWKQTEPSMS